MPFPTLRPIPRPAWAGQPQGDAMQWARAQVERIRVATTSGRVRFLSLRDTYTAETPEIRQEYREMLRDETVKAGFQAKLFAVISEDVKILPANQDDERERFAAEAANYCMRKCEGGTPGMGWSILSGLLIDGHSLSEKVWEEKPIPFGKYAGIRRWAKVKAKDTRYLSYGIDQYRNVTSIRGMGFNAGRVWSPEPFIRVAYFSLFEDPAGISDFRAARRAYVCKDAAMQMRGLHLDKFTGPYIVGKYAKDRLDQKAVLDAALLEAKANTWLTLPNDLAVEVVDLSMKGTQDFKDAIADYERQILVALLGAHLQVQEGQTNGARGNTEVHKETSELGGWYLTTLLKNAYQGQLIDEWYAENFHAMEPGEVSIGSISEQEMLTYAQLDKALQDMGFKHSRKAMARRYSREEAVDPEDVLTPAPAGTQAEKPAPGGAPAASPFSEGAEFCGGKGGDPGPCPEGGSKDQPTQTSHPHAGVAGVPEALSAAVESAKSRKELAQTVSATVNEAKAKVKQSVTGAIQGIRTEELGQYKGGLQGALHSAIREHVGDFGRDLIGHLNHEGRYTVGQLKGGETKDQIRQAMGTAHDELGPQGVADKWQFNSRYLREDLARAFAAHGHNPEQATQATEGIISSLGKRLGIARNEEGQGS